MKDQLNIIFIGESYLGGMAGSKRIQNIINSLFKTGNVQVHNLIIEKKSEASPEEKTGEKNGVRYRIVHYSISNPFRLLGHYFKGFRFLSSAKKKGHQNILYCYDTATPLNIWFLLYARMRGIKVVIDFVEDYNLLDKAGLNRMQRFKVWAFTLLENNLHRYANGIVAISGYLETKLGEKVRGKLPLMFLPITVNFDLFGAPSKEGGKTVVKIFYGGSFGEKDGLLFLLKAFDEVCKSTENVELVLTGRPPKKGMSPVLDYIEQSPNSARIHFMGYLDDATYYQTLQDCDIFCMTRVNSNYANAGFPFKLGEMLAAGKPVIATTVGDIPQFLEHETSAYLIAPDSSEAIATGIRFILDHPEQAAAIGIAGRGVALEHFDSDKIAVSLKQFLLKL